MNAKFGFIFLGCIFLLEAIWALFGGKIYFRFHGWQTIDEKKYFWIFHCWVIFYMFRIFPQIQIISQI